MPQHKHIIIDAPGEQRNYTRPPGGGRSDFRIPQRDHRVHARRLRSDLNQAESDANTIAERTGHTIHDLCLEIIGEQDYKLKIESLQDFRLKPPIELLSVKRIGDQLHATIFVPEGKLTNFIKKIEQYENRERNNDLIAPINVIRFPIFRSFWTDDENLFPSSDTECIWWEVWIRVAPTENPDEVFKKSGDTLLIS